MVFVLLLVFLGKVRCKTIVVERRGDVAERKPTCYRCYTAALDHVVSSLPAVVVRDIMGSNPTY